MITILFDDFRNQLVGYDTSTKNRHTNHFLSLNFKTYTQSRQTQTYTHSKKRDKFAKMNLRH